MMIISIHVTKPKKKKEKNATLNLVLILTITDTTLICGFNFLVSTNWETNLGLPKIGKIKRNKGIRKGDGKKMP